MDQILIGVFYSDVFSKAAVLMSECTSSSWLYDRATKATPIVLLLDKYVSYFKKGSG